MSCVILLISVSTRLYGSTVRLLGSVSVLVLKHLPTDSILDDTFARHKLLWKRQIWNSHLPKSHFPVILYLTMVSASYCLNPRCFAFLAISVNLIDNSRVFQTEVNLSDERKVTTVAGTFPWQSTHNKIAGIGWLWKNC
jgi:hypothetical protein